MKKDVKEEVETITEKALSVDDVKPEVKTYWEKRLWAGVKPVYMCKTCGLFLDNKDDMITHVVEHEPKDEQSKLLDKLLKE